MTDTKHETKQNASHTQEAEALADAVLTAAGSGLRHYSVAKTREAIITAAQTGIYASRTTVFNALAAVLPYAQAEAEGLEGFRGEDEVADEQADAAWQAVELAEAMIAETKGKSPVRFAIAMNIGGAFERLPDDRLYDTREEAEQAIKDHITDCINAVEGGDMDDSPDPSDFRVVEVIE